MGPIAHLPKSLIAHLRSSFILSDLAQALEELMCNSLDAGAKKIVASVDLASLYIKVEDDGFGINRDDLSLIGERNATSKLRDLTDLETGITTLGFRGEALSSLSDIAILEITSRARGSPNTYKKIVKGSKKLSMGLCSEHRGPGTSVVLRDLFHNLPVRRKVIRSSPRKVLQAVKDGSLRLALIHSDVSFSVIDLERQEDLIRTESCVSPLNTLCEFFGEELRYDLQELNYSKENLKLHGFVSKDASRFPSKAVQFLYLNRRFVHKTPIHKLVNAYSSIEKGFSEQGSQSECAVVLERKKWMLDTSSKHLFPAFLLNLSCPHSIYDVTFEVAKTSVEFKDWGYVLSFVKEALETVWNRSTGFLDKGGAEDLSRVGSVVPTKSPSRKRKSWQLIDPTYHPRHKVNVSNTCLLDNDSCFRGFESQSTALDSGTRLQDPCFNPMELLSDDCRGRDCSSNSHPQCYDDFPNSSWVLHHCAHKTGSHVTNSRFLRSKTKQFNLLEANFLQQKDDWEDACEMEPSNFASKVSQVGFNKGLIECRKPNEFVQEALQSKDNLSASPRCFSTESENLPFYPDSLDFHSMTETLCLDNQQGKQLNAELTGIQNGPLIDFDRDGVAAMEDEKAPLSLWKASSVSRTCVRRCLYDLYLKPGHTDDFLCHSDRQSVSNLVFRQDLDRPGQLLESHGQSDSMINLTDDWMPSNKTSEQKLVSSTSDASADSSHHEIFERELDDFNEHELSAKGSHRLFHSIYCDPCSLSHWKDETIVESRSTAAKPLLQDDLEDNLGEFIRDRHEKHLSTRKRPLWPPKSHLKRSLSAPPFFKPSRKYASCTESIAVFSKTSEDQVELLTAQHKKLLAALEGSLASRTFQETARSQQDEPQGISKVNVNTLSSPLEETGNDAYKARQTEHSFLNLDLADGNALELTTKELFKEWRNPYIKKYEKDVLDLSSGILGPMNTQLLPESISKEMLHNAQVLQQLGRKFIAVVAAGILVVVDQHAADERIRLEQLRKEVLVESKQQLSTLLDNPQKLIITMGDQQLLHTYKSQIQYWGWRFKVHSLERMSYGKRLASLFMCAHDNALLFSDVWAPSTALLHMLSICCHGQAYKGSSFALLNAVPQILGEILSDGSYLSEYLRQLAITDGTSSPPPAVLRVLATKACRGAIMFGDFLLRSECQQLIEGLKQTSLCFQCAHGRPTLVPLVNLEALHQRLGSLSCKRQCASKAACEHGFGDQSCNLMEPSEASPLGTVVWHGLQWHRPTLKRATERLKNAQGI